MGTSLVARAGQLARRLRNETPVPYVSDSVSGLTVFSPRAGGDPGAQMAQYGAVSTLFSIVSTEATAVAKLKWCLYRKAVSGKAEDRVEVTAHPALSVLNRPNDFYSTQELFETGQQHVDLAGYAFWVVAYSTVFSDIPLELWPVRPDRMTPVADAKEFLRGWVYKGPNGEKIFLERKQVLMVRMPDPEDPYLGLGPVQSIRTDAEASRYISEWNRNFFRNSAEPGGIIQFEEMLSDPEYITIRDRWREQHQGVANAHRVALLEKGKWIDRKYSQREMEFSKLRLINAEVIMEAFAFPKFMLGQVADINRNTAEASERYFAKYHTCTRADRWKGLLNNDFLPLFGAMGVGFEFDYDSPVEADQEIENATLVAKVDAWIKLTASGVAPADASAYLGIPDLGVKGVDAAATSAEQAKAIAEMSQKLYLAVGTLLSAPEARSILVAAGADIDPDAELPQPAPAADPFADPAAPADPAAMLQAIYRAVAHEHDPPGGRRGRSAALNADPGAGIDLSGVQGDWRDALAGVLARWADVTSGQRAVIYAQVESAVNAHDLDSLRHLDVPSGEAASILAVAMHAIADQGAESAVEEARKQGVTTGPGHANQSELSTVAGLVAALLAAGLANAAAREALRNYSSRSVGKDVADAVDVHLAALSDAYLSDNLGGALSRAQMAGRLATFAVAPEASLYSSEILDTRICKPCSQVSGKFLALSTDQSQIALTYPNGQYVHCLGGIRCRGQVVAVWRQDTTEDGDQ